MQNALSSETRSVSPWGSASSGTTALNRRSISGVILISRPETVCSLSTGWLSVWLRYISAWYRYSKSENKVSSVTISDFSSSSASASPAAAINASNGSKSSSPASSVCSKASALEPSSIASATTSSSSSIVNLPNSKEGSPMFFSACSSFVIRISIMRISPLIRLLSLSMSI